MKQYEVQYTVNTVDGKTVSLVIGAAGFSIDDAYMFFHDDEDQTVLAMPLSREPVVMAVTK